MDQASSFTNTGATKALSLIGGLISQMNSELGGGDAQDSLFSNLLSQSDALQTALAAQTRATTATASSTNVSSSSDASSQNDMTDNSSADLWQTLGQISSLLHQTLAAIQQKHQSSGQTSHQTSGQAASNNVSDSCAATNTQTTTAAPATTAPTTSTTPATTTTNSSTQTTPSTATTGKTAAASIATDTTSTTTNSDGASSTPKTLADIISELLAMAQIVVVALQKTQVTTGSTGATQLTPTDLLAALDAANNLTKGTNTAKGANDLLSLDVNGTEQGTGLLSFLQALQKDVQQLMPLQKTADKNGEMSITELLASSDRTTSASATVSADTETIPDLFASLDDTIKQAIAALQSQNQNTSATKNVSVLAQTATNTIAAAAETLIKPTATAQENSKTTTTPTALQFFAAAPVATTTTANTSNSANSTANTATPVAALDVKNNTEGSGEAGSDFLSGGNNSSLANSDLSSTGAGLTAANVQAKGTYSFASTLSALRAANGGATGLPSAVDQVILQMNRNVKSGNDQMSLQLHPADLGKITVKLDLTADGKVQGTVTAENPQTLTMLKSDSRSLERALQDAGLSADPGSLQFSLGGQSQQNNAGQTGQNGNNNSGTFGEDGTQSASDITGVVDIGAISESYYVTPGGVNIRV